jgi:peptidoglycan hydrolase CwlO-like protein
MIEIDEKTKLIFTGEKLLAFVVGIIVAVWAIHTYISKQTERDDNQDTKIQSVSIKVDNLEKKVDDNQKQIIDRLDEISKKQDKDHDIVIRHEYSNLNKTYYSK